MGLGSAPSTEIATKRYLTFFHSAAHQSMNPRAIAAAETKKSDAAEVEHRGELIRKLESSGEHGGTDVGSRGFKLWNAITTERLEQIVQELLEAGESGDEW